jgi:hypothetical protein
MSYLRTFVGSIVFVVSVTLIFISALTISHIGSDVEMLIDELAEAQIHGYSNQTKMGPEQIEAELEEKEDTKELWSQLRTFFIFLQGLGLFIVIIGFMGILATIDPGSDPQDPGLRYLE